MYTHLRKQEIMTAIIEVRNLVRRFGEYTAVNNVSFDVEQGEVFGLLGPNGAGKSTTIKMLTTLLPPTSGSARVAGFDIVHQKADVRRSIGYVPQALSADGNLTGYENLLLFAGLYDIPRKMQKKRVWDALEFVGLADVADKLVQHYSGGMIRRLEVAQSLLHQPRVLFLDEPTVGLDPVARQAIWDHLSRLRDDTDMTIFLTTHSMEEADSLCHRVGIMHRGDIVALDTPNNLKAAVGGEHTTLNNVFVHYAGNLEEITVKLQEPAAQRRDLGNTLTLAQPRQVSPIAEIMNFFKKTLIIASWEVRKLRHDPTDVLTRTVQPALWLLIFGEVFSRIRAIPTGQTRYLDFLAPGILSQSVLFIAIFYGIAIIWERDLGVINKFLVSPTPRLALVLGKALSAGARALPQAIIIYLLSVILGVQVNWNPLALLGVIVIVMLGAACFLPVYLKHAIA